MGKRKMVQHNLVKNSISAYFAAVEIHNKPNISYRYETTTLLLINAWELILKAFIKKKIKNKSIYENNEHTISITKALDYVEEYMNALSPKSFMSIKENILLLEEYRNRIIHYYNEQLEPYIFMLLAKSALNYVRFVNDNFNKDILAEDGLFILPLGFKLPFRPEEFLSRKSASYLSTKESRMFMESMIQIIEKLNNEEIEDTIVLGFDIYLENVKKMTNSDLLVAITKKEEADVIFSKNTNIRLTDDKSAQKFNVSDDGFRAIWKYTHEDVVKWCVQNISDFKQGKKFNAIKKIIEQDSNCVYIRKLDSSNEKSVGKKFYSELAFEAIKEVYERE